MKSSSTQQTETTPRTQDSSRLSSAVFFLSTDGTSYLPSPFLPHIPQDDDERPGGSFMKDDDSWDVQLVPHEPAYELYSSFAGVPTSFPSEARGLIHLLMDRV